VKLAMNQAHLVLHASDEKLDGSLGMRLVFSITARGHGNT